MDKWLNDQTQRGVMYPLLIIAVFVVVFLEIHPFQDGNGRLSRVLTTLLLLKSGYSYVPYSSMESVIELALARGIAVEPAEFPLDSAEYVAQRERGIQIFGPTRMTEYQLLKGAAEQAIAVYR